MLRSEAFELVAISLKLGELLSFGEGGGHALAAELCELGFVVESLEVGWAAGHTKVNDALGLGRVVQFVSEGASPLGGGCLVLPEEREKGGASDGVGGVL